MSTLTAVLPEAPAPTTAEVPWLVSAPAGQAQCASPRDAAERLADLAPHGHHPGEPLPFRVHWVGEETVDYTGYADDVFRATGWYNVSPEHRRTPEGLRFRELVVELVGAILVGA